MRLGAAVKVIARLVLDEQICRLRDLLDSILFRGRFLIVKYEAFCISQQKFHIPFSVTNAFFT